MLFGGISSIFKSLMDYLDKNAQNYVDMSDKDVRKIIALSTCADVTTNGRAVLFCTAVPRLYPVDIDNPPQESGGNVGTEGHAVAAKNWALLNLVCVIFTVITLIPLLFTRKKYGQYRVAKKLINKYESYVGMDFVVDRLKRFIKRFFIGLVLEIIVVIISIVVFICTEDMTTPFVIRDEWTGLMVLIFAAALLIDFICFRYRGERLTDDDKDIE